MTLDPIFPLPLVLCLGAALIAVTLWVYLSVGRTLGKWRSWLLLLLRLGALGCLLAILLRPSVPIREQEEESHRLTMIALDTSRSMNQPDVDNASRIDSARELLASSKLMEAAAVNENAEIRLFAFDDGARPVPVEELATLPAEGEQTYFHSSLEAILDTLSAGEEPEALVLLTDGHDLEMVSASRTARIARSHSVPIYAVPLGGLGKVRDISVRMASYQPYSFVNQRAKVSTLLRVVGCEHETIQVQIRKGGELVETKVVETKDLPEIAVEFSVFEQEVGQHEYEVRALPLAGESETSNNSSVTYLNVIDQRIRVLLLEGSPYWDTTFLQRTLFANEKIDLDAVLRFAEGRARRIRNSPELGDLKIPETADDLRPYTAIVLGKQVQDLLGVDFIPSLDEYVRDGGILVYARGQAYPSGIADELDPVTWEETGSANVKLTVARDGNDLSAFKMLRTTPGGVEGLPSLLAGRRVGSPKTLSSTLAKVEDPEGGDSFPAVVHRRFGRGQVLSVGVDGLWKWALNPKVEESGEVFDAFWDQLMLWLLARSDLSPEKELSFRADTANLRLGEKLHFRLSAREEAKLPERAPVTVLYNDQQVAELMLAGGGDEAMTLSGTFVPPEVGRYSASIRLPSGEEQMVKFMVYEERLETTEVATDVGFLKALAEGTGGRVVKPEDLDALVRGLQDTEGSLRLREARTELDPVWDNARWFYLIGLFLALDWFLRRRWGLA